MSTKEQAETIQEEEGQPTIKLNITLHGKLLLPLEVKQSIYQIQNQLNKHNK